jgi:hypothetical protein
VPSFVGGPAGQRTLVMSRERAGRVAYTVLRGREPMLGESETPVNDATRRRMDDLVAGLAGGRAGDGQALTRMGVQYVLVPRPARDSLTQALDATPELSRLSRTESFGLWGLPAPAGRLMLLDGPTAAPLDVGETAARVDIPAGRATRTLLLAEPADGGWRASLDGREVKARTLDGWAQGYEIPAGGGRFELSRSMWGRHIWVGLQGAAFLLVLVLALPGARPETVDLTKGGGHRRAPRTRALARRAAAGAERRTGALRARVRHDEDPAPDDAAPASAEEAPAPADAAPADAAPTTEAPATEALAREVPAREVPAPAEESTPVEHL